VDRDKETMWVKKDKKLGLKGRRTKNNLYKVHVCIVPGGGEEVAGSTWATEPDEYSDARSCK
jgi:hypothetical protein